jgi:site-specific recombinase XerD
MTQPLTSLQSYVLDCQARRLSSNTLKNYDTPLRHLRRFLDRQSVTQPRDITAAHVPEPSAHDFRRAFALLSLRGGCDVKFLQRLMGHADLTVLRRYLAQTESDLQAAHAKSSPVDRML